VVAAPVVDYLVEEVDELRVDPSPELLRKVVLLFLSGRGRGDRDPLSPQLVAREPDAHLRQAHGADRVAAGGEGGQQRGGPGRDGTMLARADLAPRPRAALLAGSPDPHEEDA